MCIVCLFDDFSVCLSFCLPVFFFFSLYVGASVCLCTSVCVCVCVCVCVRACVRAREREMKRKERVSERTLTETHRTGLGQSGSLQVCPTDCMHGLHFFKCPSGFRKGVDGETTEQNRRE
mmetsp:Transcript_28709/g.56242  ORF Transcript_28709/g.56242 Transcript_28709/m.56242 type:complete len:120 (+) Transcript_28709:1085-1444(+)